MYDAQLKQVWVELDRMEDNRHFDSMEASECTYWEKIMQINLTGEETLEDRRRNIKRTMGIKPPIYIQEV